MGNNVFYVYIRLKNSYLTQLLPTVREALNSHCGDNTILCLSVCKERELEACIGEKVGFWKEHTESIEVKINGAELVIHQIQVSNGGIELSPVIMSAIGEANLLLSMTYTVCKLV